MRKVGFFLHKYERRGVWVRDNVQSKQLKNLIKEKKEQVRVNRERRWRR